MENQHNQSYYEIALTNRQVMSIFVVLLISVLAAFLGGVWMGRGGDTAVEMASAQSITAGVTDGDAVLEELDFFARREDPPAAGESSPAVGRPTPGPAALEARPEPERSRSQPPARGAGEEAVTREAPEPPVVAAAEISGSETEPPTTESPAVEPASPAAAEAGPGAEIAEVPDYVVVQVFSSPDQGQARRVVNRLRKGGYPAILSPVEVDGRILHRVRIGPYTDRDEAQVVAASVRRTFKLDTWITN